MIMVYLPFTRGHDMNNIRLIDLTNKKFGRLTVIKPVIELGKRKWVCKCECGSERTVYSQSLKSGLTKSCGCLRSESSSKRFTTHGKRQLPEYAVWNMMIQRCENARNASFIRYGGRGICVCLPWHDFSIFYADMGPRPSEWHTIERINNDGDYTPVNCVWALKTRQANNRRSSRYIEFRGRRMTLRQIFEETNCGIKFDTLRSRVFEKGWTIEDALNRPLR
jgi:hypothetical protein